MKRLTVLSFLLLSALILFLNGYAFAWYDFSEASDPEENQCVQSDDTPAQFMKQCTPDIDCSYEVISEKRDASGKLQAIFITSHFKVPIVGGYGDTRAHFYRTQEMCEKAQKKWADEKQRDEKEQERQEKKFDQRYE